jgi:hypothetical protein
MNSKNIFENRRLILNSKQLYVLEQRAWQLQNKLNDCNTAEIGQQEDTLFEEIDEGASFILGYN